MKVRVEVTQDDIDRGTPRSCVDCPIARALRRLFPDAEFEVGNLNICVYRVEAANLAADTPLDADLFISNYDDDEWVTPFAFDIEFEEATL